MTLCDFEIIFRPNFLEENWTPFVRPKMVFIRSYRKEYNNQNSSLNYCKL